MLCLPLYLPLLLSPGPELSTVAPAACVPAAGDYTYQWWAEGWRGRRVRFTRTGQYGFALDVEKMTVPHWGPLLPGGGYRQPAAEAEAAVRALPPAELELALTVGGTKYRCVAGGPATAHGGPRLIESGRFVQRADVTDLVFADEQGRRLAVEARCETVAWPDRLALLLEAMPQLAAPRAGDSFGRAGGGWSFDGTNHLETPHAPELDPEQLTLALWVYVPALPPATRYNPWIIGKNANEWAPGAYGLWLDRGAPVGLLNIGGGRENAHLVSTRTPGRARPGAGEVLTTEAWHHLALTYDGQTLRLYVDGRERDAAPIGKRRAPGNLPLVIGRRPDNSGDGYHFRGVVDEVRLYSRALAAEEVRALWQSPETPAATGLVRAWSFAADGPALARRPSEEWRDATLAIGLRAGGRTHREELRLAPGETWGAGQRRAVALCLTPGGEPAGGAPVDVQAVAHGKTDALPVSYDDARGWHRIGLDAVRPERSHNDALERVRLVLANPSDQPRPVRLLFDKNAAGMKVGGLSVPTGLSPLLRDGEGEPCGIPVQISKNWHSQADRQLLYQGAWLHGFSLLRLPARSRVELEFALAYAHWGGVAAASHAQLCLIGWGSNQLWDEAALGCWGESICFEPDQAQAQAAVLDVRPVMVHQMGQDQPRRWGWTNNVGGGDFFRLFDAQGQRVWPAGMTTTYHRQGPCLTEVTYAGASQDRRLTHAATVSLYRSDDIVRGVYRLRLDVREATDCQRFVIFQIGADTYSYTGERKMALGHAGGLTREWATQWGGNAYRGEPLACAGQTPWVSLHEAVRRDSSKAGAWANRGVVVRAWRARLGGREAGPWCAEYGVGARGINTSTIDFVPPPDVRRLLPGDFVEATFEHVVMPQFARDYYGPNENLRAALTRDENTWRPMWREAAGNDLQVTAARGVVERTWPVRVRAAGDRAEFSVTGGLGYVPLTIAGLTSCRAPCLEQREGDGPWQPVDQAVHGKDFWQVDRDAASGTYEVTYTVKLDTPGDERRTRGLRFGF